MQMIFDPIPDRYQPCLAVLKPKVPAGPEWQLEIKFDGYRVSLIKNGQEVIVRTKGGHDWTHRFPLIAEAARALSVETIVLDGEAVMLDDRGRSDFNLLQKTLGPGTGRKPAGTAIMFAFDVLYFDGHDISKLDLEERRIVLESALSGQESGIYVSEIIETDDVPTIMSHVCGLGLEGIIAKHRRRPYRPGRNGDWVKIKCVQSETFVVLGYTPEKGGGVSRLLLGARRGEKLVYVGSVGSGIGWRTGARLRELLEKFRRKPTSPSTERGAIWTTPAVLVEVKFRGWTDDNKLRHASYKGQRSEGDATDIFQLEDEL